jgi:hypothetical protein
MSRAFVKETAEGAPPPERMVSSGPNLVTEAGLTKIAARVERLEAALAAEKNVLLREPWSATCATGGSRSPPRRW